MRVLRVFLIFSFLLWGRLYSDKRYAIVVSEETYNDDGWREVVDSLLQKHNGVVFIYEDNIYELEELVSQFSPDYIAFVCRIPEASAAFVRNVWIFTRNLDDDPYGDAIWGIITGCEPADVLNKIGPLSIDIKTVLGEQIPLSYYPQGISTNEVTYGQYSVKYPDSLSPVSFSDGPTDRTVWLVSMLNGDSLIFGDSVDIFYTSGHGNHNVWQLHYPDPGLEGYFRSDNTGHLFGDPYSGPDVDIFSPNPKIYFGLGNCYIAKIIGAGCMAPAWIRNGGAYLYTGYVIEEGPESYQLGATQAYFAIQNHYPWPVAFFLGNQVFKFDIDNNTPGVGSPPDFNGAALYGDPAVDARIPDSGFVTSPLLYSTELIIKEGEEWDTMTFRIRMNVEGKPGYNGKWGNRSPIVLLPWKIDSPFVLETNAYQVVITENFALMYIWHEGEPPLEAGTERYVTFIARKKSYAIKEGKKIVRVEKRGENSFSLQSFFSKGMLVVKYRVRSTEIPLSLEIYDLSGRKVKTLFKGLRKRGFYEEIWRGETFSNKKSPQGIYFLKLSSSSESICKKVLWFR